MGNDGLLPAALGRADRLGTPVAALLCSTVMSLAFVQVGGFESVATVFSVFAFTGYLSALVSLLVLRHREPGLARPFRVWGAPWTVAAVIAGYLAILGGVVAGAPRDAAIAIGALAAGYAVYRLTRSTRMIISVPLPCSGPASWARRSPPISPTPASRRCCSTSPPRPQPKGSSEPERSSPIRSSCPTAGRSSRRPRSTRGCRGSARPTGSWSASSSSSTPSARCSSGWMPRGARAAIVSSNTSGIPVGVLAEGRSDDFRRHWLGTHFFNPPRYLRLLELIPTPDTDPAVLAGVRRLRTCTSARAWSSPRTRPTSSATISRSTTWCAPWRSWPRARYSIEEIDAITGPPIGRPKSATFRTLDLAGIDILAHVVRNLAERLGDPARAPRSCCRRSWRRCWPAGWTGEKAGQGFYKRVKGDDGESQILVDRSGHARVPPAGASEAPGARPPRKR